jgi:site-specific DNA-methyltransferase (adenine-specific)
MAGTNPSLKRGAAREIISLPVSEVRPYEKNPRKNAEAVKYVKASIEKFGFKVPIVIDSNRVVVCGHTRLMAAKSLGMAEVPCIMASDLTDEQIKAFRLADNKVGEFAKWDYSLLGAELSDIASMSDIDMGEFGFDLDSEEEPEIKEDEVPEEVESVCKRGEIWQLGEHRLMCGDSTKREDVAKLMNGELAHLWLTDPPYNVAIENSQGMTIQNDSMASDDFRKFLIGAFDAANSVMAKGCPFYIWFATREHMNFEGALNDVGLQVRQELIWNKNSIVLGRSHYQWKHEPCLYGWKGDSCRYFIDRRDRATVIEDEEEIDIDKMKKDEMKELLHKIYESKIPTTVINCPKPTKDADHPTMKPVRLFGYQMQNSSRQGDIILDTFGGSGTTIVAAEQLDRKARLMELDPHYCDVIIARWEKLTGQKAEKLGGADGEGG